MSEQAKIVTYGWPKGKTGHDVTLGIRTFKFNSKQPTISLHEAHAKAFGPGLLEAGMIVMGSSDGSRTASTTEKDEGGK